ncbi:MAG TPA: S8 family serine peptidase [Symbiobacteriaceae bacterium]|nr:S8 family serine peptidase [Symbiobacteriaceae bacterium]
MRKFVFWLMLVALILAIAAVPAAATEPGMFLVILNQENVDTQTLDAVQQAGGEVTGRLDQIGVIAVSTSNASAFLDAVQRVPGVMSVAPDMTWEVSPDWAGAEVTGTSTSPENPADPAAYTWGVQRVTANGAAWAIHEGTHDVVVAVVDSGIDLTHPDLAGNIVPGSRSFIPGAGPQDQFGHGTHLAGIIAANGRIKGVAPGVGLRAYRVFNAQGKSTDSSILQGIVAAAEDGVDVINLSLGGKSLMGQSFRIDPVTGKRTPNGNGVDHWVAQRRAIQYAVRHNATVVAAVGNDSLDLTNRNAVTQWWNGVLASQGQPVVWEGATFISPAETPGALAVSGLGGGWGTADRLAFYSNYGTGVVSITAPGGDRGPIGNQDPDAHKYRILSTVPPAVMCSAITRSLFGTCGYHFSMGTSQAAPHVAGAAALVISEAYARTGVKPSPAQVVATLLQTADDVGKVGYDEFYGHGMVNAYRALVGK